MTKLQFDDIEIRSFRGIKQYTLNFDKKSLVFCGANGTGKSSFVIRQVMCLSEHILEIIQSKDLSKMV